MILVIGNTMQDVQVLLNRTTTVNTEVINGITINKVRINTLQNQNTYNGCFTDTNQGMFLVAYGGTGKVNVARTIQYILDNYEITYIIGTGNTASLVATTAMIGNVAISTGALQYDVDYTGFNTPIHVLPGYTISTYPANQTLINNATTATITTGLTGVNGLFASADQITASTTEAQDLNTTYGIAFLDDNSGTIGQMAYINNIPYVIVKGISNYADDNALTDYNANYITADTNANNVVYQMLLTLIQINPQPTNTVYLNPCCNNCNRCSWLWNICSCNRCNNNFWF